jgi:rhodanese-related sulfurtransferase
VKPERVLAAVALVLGFGAAFAGSPFRAGPAAGSLLQVGAQIEARQGSVTPVQLARWLRDREPDLRLIDLRQRSAFDDFTLPRAESFPLEWLLEPPEEPEPRLVLLSADGVMAAQAWTLARLAGHSNPLVLEGGVAGWIRTILAPIVPADPPEDEREGWEELTEISEYFGGQPRRMSDLDQVPPLPDLRGEPDLEVEQLLQWGRDQGCGW